MQTWGLCNSVRLASCLPHKLLLTKIYLKRFDIFSIIPYLSHNLKKPSIEKRLHFITCECIEKCGPQLQKHEVLHQQPFVSNFIFMGIVRAKN